MSLRIKHLLFLSILILFSAHSSAQSNIVVNGDFESGLSQWSYWFDTSNGYNASFQTTTSQVFQGTASGEVNISSIGSAADYNKIMVKNTSFTIAAGTTYDVSFYLKSSSTQNFRVQLHEDSSPWTSYALQYFTPASSWQEYTFSFTSQVSTSDVRFALKLGNAVATYHFDNISIKQQVAQQYSTIIDSDYSIDWSRSGIPGGIPDIPNTINVTDYGAIGNGTTDNLTAFQNALNALQPGGALYIPSGDYLINGYLELSAGQVLRGECPSNTKLLFNVGSNAGCIEIITYAYGTWRPVSSGYTKGSNKVIFADVSGITVGSYLEVQQTNDPVLMFTDPAWDESWADSSVGQMFEVVAIAGNEVTLDRPFFYGFDSNMSPEARPLGLLEEAGVENLYIERLDASDGFTIELVNTARCWVRNVESNMTTKSHIDVRQGIDCEFRESYLHHSHDYGGGGHGYGVNITRHTTSCLVENNVFKTLRHSMLIQVGATGNVFGYNYSTDPNWNFGILPTDISMHGHFPTMNLFEGNIVQKATFSDYWGAVGPGNTMFRNRVEQEDILVDEYSHNQNVIANELTGGSAMVSVDGSVQNTWAHSNDTNGIIDNSSSQPVPASLYLSVFPEFLNAYAFPTLGFDVAGLNSIPAKDRFDSGSPMMACFCNLAMDCFDVCPVYLDDTHLGGGDPHTVLEADYLASDEIESSGTLKIGATIGYHANNEILLLPGFCTGDALEFEADLSGCP